MEGQHVDVVVKDQQSMSSIERKVSSIENEIFRLLRTKRMMLDI